MMILLLSGKLVRVSLDIHIDAENSEVSWIASPLLR